MSNSKHQITIGKDLFVGINLHKHRCQHKSTWQIGNLYFAPRRDSFIDQL
jgi:hypothetical protein